MMKVTGKHYVVCTSKRATFNGTVSVETDGAGCGLFLLPSSLNDGFKFALMIVCRELQYVHGLLSLAQRLRHARN